MGKVVPFPPQATPEHVIELRLVQSRILVVETELHGMLDKIEELELEMEQLLTRRQDLVNIAQRDELIYQSTEVNKTDDT